MKATRGSLSYGFDSLFTIVPWLVLGKVGRLDLGVRINKDKGKYSARMPGEKAFGYEFSDLIFLVFTC